MIRVDPSNWTSDFRIARALAEAYSASGLEDVLFFCVGDPGESVSFLGSSVADETRKYFPNVMGTSDSPITADNLAECIHEVERRWPDAFIVAIEAGYGRDLHLGSIEITDRPLGSLGNLDILGHFGDITVNAVLRLTQSVQAPGERAAGSRRGAIGLRAAVQEVGSDDEAPKVGRKAFKPLRPDQVNRSAVQKIADVIIDGNLRFLSKIGKQRL